MSLISPMRLDNNLVSRVWLFCPIFLIFNSVINKNRIGPVYTEKNLESTFQKHVVERRLNLGSKTHLFTRSLWSGAEEALSGSSLQSFGWCHTSRTHTSVRKEGTAWYLKQCSRHKSTWRHLVLYWLMPHCMSGERNETCHWYYFFTACQKYNIYHICAWVLSSETSLTMTTGWLSSSPIETSAYRS